MINETFIALVHWVISKSYFFFFIAAVLEGPLVTAAAGVAAALGYYSLPIIILLSVLGDVVADVVYYGIGYWSRKTLITRYGEYVGLTKERIEYFERLLHRHVRKALIVIKLSPAIPIPGLIMIGAARVPFRKFITTALIIMLPKSLLFAFLGFFTGRAYERLSNVITSTQDLIAFLTLVIFASYIAYKKISGYIARQIK